MTVPNSCDTWRVAALTMMGKEQLHAALLQDVAWVKSAAALGVPAAQVRLGRMLLEGEGLPKDHATAFQSFRLAAERGDIDGHNMLGRCFENGWGTPIDYAQAAREYRIAAEAGLDWAQYNLGHMLLSGSGVPSDPDEAFLWYSRAAEQCHVRAMNLVGRCCEEGWGTKKDARAAVLWYRRSARGGYFRGACNYASVLAAQNCIAGARHWFGRAVKTAPEPTRSNILSMLAVHPIGAIHDVAKAATQLTPVTLRN